MRNILVYISFIAFVYTANAQKISLDWQLPQKNVIGKVKPYFNGASFQQGLPKFSKSYSNKFISSIKIKNGEYELLSDKEIKQLPKNFNQTSVEANVTNGKSRGEWITTVSFIPIRKNGQVFEKLVSFSLEPEIGSTAFSKTNSYDWKLSSVLSSGTWYKVSTVSTGIHKIDYNFIQNELGVDPSTIDPRRIKIYGNGGEMLPQKNDETWFDDIDENAIFVSGEADGNFDSGDYILFYSQGIVGWELNEDTVFIHEKNKYSDEGYYFINLTSSGNGKRITSQSNVSGATVTFDYFDAYDVFESEENNIVHSGRNWYGHKFDFELSKSYAFSTAGIRSNPGLSVTTCLGGVSKTTSTFQISLNNGTSLGSSSISAYTNSDYPQVKVNKTTWPAIQTSASNQSISVSYNKGSSSSSVGYMDYIRLNYQKNLSLTGNQMNFRSIESLNYPVSNFVVGNTSSFTKIWDVTDITNVKSITFGQSGSFSSFSANSTSLHEYVVFSGSNFTLPTAIGAVENQNIHALTTPDFLIVYHPLFKSQAERLATHRAENDNLNVETVDIFTVYNEFSSGKKDPTAIRNLAKMFYDRGADKFKYLLLFGDCSYDYKERITNNLDFVPVYESRNSENPITSHSSDDYFALLDDTEGRWCESCSLTEYLDIGVGRIPSKTVEEAKGVVDKIIHYDDEKNEVNECVDATTYNSGKWKNEIVIIADDSDGNRHMKSAENIGDIMENYSDFHVDKIYIDAYEQISGAGGQTAPDVKNAINRKMERGALIFNYSGHGGELGLSHEGVISVDQIRNWNNFDNMPLMFTATCEFGRYDDPERTSAGEYTLLNDQGGVVSIVTTTRPVYSSQNDKINSAFFNSVFEPIDSTTGEMPRLGDVMRNAKNASVSSNDVNNRNFALLGDPSLRLAYPKENVIITSINENTLNDTISDTISALQKVVMSGEIRNSSNQLINTFNGVVEVSVFDKSSNYITLGDEKGSPKKFTERDVKLFEGLATVKNGLFQFTFIVPKDIKYTFGTGKVMFYASSHDLDIDANGSNSQFIVGGTSRNAATDLTPPEINIFMNDESFVFGGTTNDSPFLLTKLFDEHGINTTGVGIGHEISSILDDRSDDVIVLNDFYTSELDDYQRGIVKYPLENLTPGRHKIEVKAWDTYNNSNTEYLEFIVVNDALIALDNILNYPNPFTTNTAFHFDHNRFCDDLQVMIQVYTVSGKLIKTLEQDFIHAPAHISSILWDGKDDFGKNIGRGVYIYKVKVRSLSDGAQVQEYQKLVILK